ncbi:SigE family RNA polymerase sigma factor [Dactylosporangium sp. CS-033363]|uniref:SigE family RNA polymerase sigma factor n=1 Tax=Dactylosporangium sp. CS-033363 TaxID=3239935 RepID=UPI003D905C97
MTGAPDFDDFYSGSYRRLVGQLYAMTGDLGAAEEAVQDAYIRAWQRWATVSAYLDPEAWVRTVAYRLAVSNWRRAVNRLAAHRRHGLPDNVPDPGPDHVALVDALRQLPPDMRRVLVLHHLVGLAIDDIARETGVAIGTVKSRLSRGRKALAATLGDSFVGGAA